MTKRRDFLKTAGGIVVGFTWSVPTVLAQQAARPALPGSLGTNRMLNGWIRINPAGTVTVFTGKCELGQGILTALAQIAAEELDIAYERVAPLTFRLMAIAFSSSKRAAVAAPFFLE